MKTKQVTVCEGEYLGPVDWNYDFKQHDWEHGGGSNPESIERRIAMLNVLESQKKYGVAYEATTDGGFPRVGWGKVLEVGMYDGWPFWKPIPSVLIAGFLGSSWHWFGSITGIRREGDVKV